MATGLFKTGGQQGLNFRHRRTRSGKRPMRTIDQFAEYLSEHDASAKPPRKGGNAAEAARRCGLSESSGNGLLQRLRRELGWQAQ